MKALRSLLVIGVLLTAGGFTSDILGDYLGPIEYKGFLVFDYPEGENPIINIVFTVDSLLAKNIIILSVPSSWSHSYGGGTLTLRGGSLNPGGSVTVTVSLDKYFEEGEYPVSSVGTTSTGEVSQTEGPLLVGDLYILGFLGMVSVFRLPLAGIVTGLALLELFLSRRKQLRKKSFSETSGLEIEPAPIEYRTGTEDTAVRKLPGLKKYPNITLKRGNPLDAEGEKRVETSTQEEPSRDPKPVINSKKVGKEVDVLHTRNDVSDLKDNLVKESDNQFLPQEWEKYLLDLDKRFESPFSLRLLQIFGVPEAIAHLGYYVRNFVRGPGQEVKKARQHEDGERWGRDFRDDLERLLENEDDAKEFLKYVDHFADELARKLYD